MDYTMDTGHISKRTNYTLHQLVLFISNSVIHYSISITLSVSHNHFVCKYFLNSNRKNQKYKTRSICPMKTLFTFLK